MIYRQRIIGRDQFPNWLRLAILAPVLAVLLASQGASAQESAPSSDRWRSETIGPRPDWSWLGRLRFATDANYPPFNYRDQDGALTGFNVDLANAICDELAVICEISPLGWEQLLPALSENRADAVIASLAISPDTLEVADFTRSYYATPAKFVVRSGSDIEGVTPDDLDGVRIGVEKNTAHEAFLQDFFAESEIVAFDDQDAVRAALRNDEVALIFGDAIGMMFWINGADSRRCCEFRGRGFMEAKYFGEGVGIAVAKNNIRLKEVLNYAIVRVRATGKLEELQLRYFPLAIY